MDRITPEYLQLLILRDKLAQCSQEEQAQVAAVAETIRGIVKSNADAGVIALALVGAEVAADETSCIPAIMKEDNNGASA